MILFFLLPLGLPLVFLLFRWLARRERRRVALAILAVGAVLFGLSLWRYHAHRGDGLVSADGALVAVAILALVALSVVGWCLGASERRAGA